MERRHHGDERAIEHDRAAVQNPRLGRHAEGLRPSASQYIERTKCVCMMPLGAPGRAAREHDVEQVVGGDLRRHERFGLRGGRAPG